ncbi:MAG: hypothetical protein ACFFCB_02420 [Candidatus Odinarchaeota archaeon]
MVNLISERTERRRGHLLNLGTDTDQLIRPFFVVGSLKIDITLMYPGDIAFII